MAGTVVVTEGYVLDSSALLEEAAKILADEGLTAVTTEQRTGTVVPAILRSKVRVFVDLYEHWLK